VGDKGGNGMDIFYFLLLFTFYKDYAYHSKYTIATANLLTIILQRRR